MNQTTTDRYSICFIYDEDRPIFDESRPVTRQILYIDHSQLQSSLLQQDPECKLVFFPLKKNRNLFYKEIHTIFPRAQFISYSRETDPEYEVLSRDLDFACHVYVPLSTSLLDFILERSMSFIRPLEQKLDSRFEEQRRFLDSFNEILNIIDLNADKTSIFTEFSVIVSRLLNIDNFLIYVFEKDKQQLELVHAVQNIFGENDLLEFKFNNVFLEDIFQSRQHFISNAFNKTTVNPSGNTEYVIQSILVYPFDNARDTSGLFLAVNKKDEQAFDDIDLHYLEFLSTPFTLILKSLLDHERLQKLTITDDLTNLYNFRYLRQYLGFEIKRCLRYNKTLSLLFTDVDNFKDVNDTYGHLVGSAVLCELGQLFNKMVRDTDVIVRYGGDEFVIILPDTSLEGARVIAERLRERVEKFRFKGGRNLQIQLTVSIGIASCPDHSITAEELLQKADAAMYAAKDDSKNNIKVAG